MLWTIACLIAATIFAAIAQHYAFTRGTTYGAHIVTSLLRNGPLTGMELKKKVGERGSFYVVMGQLEEAGIVESREEPPTPERHGYSGRLYWLPGRGAERKEES